MINDKYNNQGNMIHDHHFNKLMSIWEFAILYL